MNLPLTLIVDAKRWRYYDKEARLTNGEQLSSAKAAALQATRLAQAADEIAAYGTDHEGPGRVVPECFRVRIDTMDPVDALRLMQAGTLVQDDFMTASVDRLQAANREARAKGFNITTSDEYDLLVREFRGGAAPIAYSTSPGTDPELRSHTVLVDPRRTNVMELWRSTVLDAVQLTGLCAVVWSNKDWLFDPATLAEGSGRPKDNYATEKLPTDDSPGAPHVAPDFMAEYTNDDTWDARMQLMTKWLVGVNPAREGPLLVSIETRTSAGVRDIPQSATAKSGRAFLNSPVARLP